MRQLHSNKYWRAASSEPVDGIQSVDLDPGLGVWALRTSLVLVFFWKWVSQEEGHFGWVRSSMTVALFMQATSLNSHSLSYSFFRFVNPKALVKPQSTGLAIEDSVPANRAQWQFLPSAKSAIRQRLSFFEPAGFSLPARLLQSMMSVIANDDV